MLFTLALTAGPAALGTPAPAMAAAPSAPSTSSSPSPATPTRSTPGTDGTGSTAADGTGTMPAGPGTGGPGAAATSPTPTRPAGVAGGSALAGTGVAVDPSAATSVPETSAASWVVTDLDTGAVLAAKDAHGLFPPASTLKVLTALTLIPEIPADEQITIPEAAVEVDGSRVGLPPGATYSAHDLFSALLVVSANDAAEALAAAAPGGRDATVAAMNAEAHRLGAYDTVARNPTGLDDPRQVTSAFDLALLGRAGLRMPELAAYAEEEVLQLTAPDGTVFGGTSHNPLLGRYDGLVGLKQGGTTKALATYVAAAQRDGRTVLVSLLHANPSSYATDARKLLDWGFAHDGQVTPVGDLDTGTPPLATRTPAPTSPPSPSAPAAEPSHPSLRGAAHGSTAAEGGVGGSALSWPVRVLAVLVAAVVLLRIRARRRIRLRRMAAAARRRV